MSYDDKPLFDFLAERKFTGLNGGIYSKGKCHDPDNKHFILLTDGMLIYSNIPDHTEEKFYTNTYIQHYHLSYADMNKVVDELKFSFDSKWQPIPVFKGWV